VDCVSVVLPMRGPSILAPTSDATRLPCAHRAAGEVDVAVAKMKVVAEL